MWVEVDGSPAWRETAGGSIQYVRTFDATVNQGRTLAASEGYTRGATQVLEGFFLTLTGIDVRNRSGRDVVRVVWSTKMGSSGRQPHSDYNDDVLRKDGDEEWLFEFESEEKPAVECVKHDGSVFSGSWGVGEDDMLLQPGIILVWRKWMDKNTASSGKPPVTVPRTKAKALDAIRTYLPNQTGNYESNGPKLMYRLGSSGIEKNFLCIDIEIEPDGDLVCRTARFKWRASEWGSTIYG